jgi:hypothetical protein
MADGKAYGFLYYDGKTEDIAGELPRARDAFPCPTELHTDVKEISDINVQNDTGLAAIVEQAKSFKMSHVIEGTLPHQGNRAAADNIYNIIGYIGLSELFEGKPLNTGTVYERGGKYIFKRT